MPQTKPLNQVVDKWKRRAAQASPDYLAGVRSPKRDWASATGEAEENYEAGIQQSISDKRFGAGVSAAGTAKWQRKAIAVGAQRFGPGVAAAAQEYQDKVSKVLNVIDGVSLPPGGPAGDPRNFQRSEAIGKALHEAKVAGQLR